LVDGDVRVRVTPDAAGDSWQGRDHAEGKLAGGYGQLAAPAAREAPPQDSSTKRREHVLERRKRPILASTAEPRSRVVLMRRCE
jgi:hypothetical protein